jgi:hypothetical protein
MRLRLGLSLTFLLGTACSSATVPDAGTTADAAVRADARPQRRRGPARRPRARCHAG